MKYKALLVDDQPNVLREEVKLMQEIDDVGEIFCASSGESALQIIQEKAPDLMLLDWDLGIGINGIDLIKKLKEDSQTEDTVVIIVTAFTGPKYIEKAIESGATDYIPKPIDKFEFLMRCEAALMLYQEEQCIREQRNILWHSIEKQKAREAQIKRRNKLLMVETNFKKQIISIVLHDIRSPITGVYLFLELLLKNPEEKFKEDIESILEDLLNSIKSLNNTLENIIQWSHNQTERLPLYRSFCFVQDVIDESVSLCYAMLKNKDLSIVIDLHDKKTKVYADKNMFSFTVRNLLSNAIKFSFRGNTIRIHSRELENNLIEIAIKDKGLGIPEGMKKKIFKTRKIFLQKGTEGEQGTGLGLFLCKEFIEKNNGVIDFTSDSKGSTFYLRLPKTPSL